MLPANIGEVKSLACIKKSASCIKASTAMKWYDLTELAPVETRNAKL